MATDKPIDTVELMARKLAQESETVLLFTAVRAYLLDGNGDFWMDQPGKLTLADVSITPAWGRAVHPKAFAYFRRELEKRVLKVLPSLAHDVFQELQLSVDEIIRKQPGYSDYPSPEQVSSEA